MIKKTAITGLLIILAFHTHAKPKEPYKNKFHIKLSTGYDFGSKFLEDKSVDPFIAYDDKRSYYPEFSVAYFFSKHWGIEASIKASNSRKRERVKELEDQYIPVYEDNYFISLPLDENSISMPVFSFGAVYRLETKHFFFHPKIALGITDIRLQAGDVLLKEKNSHQRYLISYTPNKETEESLTVIPAISFGYKLSKRFWLNLEAKLAWQNSGYRYTITSKDLTTGMAETEIIKDRKDIFTFTIGGGIIFAF